ncbi:hypothetical protein [Bosea thiooxidans]
MLSPILGRTAGLLPALLVVAIAAAPALSAPRGGKRKPAKPPRPAAQQQEPRPLPIPRGALQDHGADEGPGTAAAANGADALLFDPSLAAIGRAAAASGAHLRARAPIPVDIIREGFAARASTAGSAPDRSVGFKLGRDELSLQTTVSQPARAGQAADSRLGWRLARPVAANTGFIWGLSTGGNTTLAGKPEQSGDALVGYRQRVFEHLTLTSQLGMAGNYAFEDHGFHSAVTPEVKLSVDLAKAADLPWQTSLDVSLARQLPLAATDFETRGTALISLRYKLQ